MALAYGDFHELSHQLRFLLFEMGIGLQQNAVEAFISSAHRNCLQRLQQSALREKLINEPLQSHHVHDFLYQLKNRLALKNEDAGWQILRQELDDSIANEALAMAYRQRWQQELIREAKGYFRFWDWLRDAHSAAQLLSFLEQWGSHPCYPNLNPGFTRREVLQYSPEFNAQVKLHWCALRRSAANTFSRDASSSYNSLIEKHFPHEYAAFREKLLFKQSNPDEFHPVPVHPWQWRNRLQQSLSPLIDKKELHLIPYHQITRPTLSFPTMIAGDNTCRIKLPLTVVAHHETALSAVINKLLAQHNYYHQSLYLTQDLAGIQLATPSKPDINGHQLSLSLHENPHQAINNEDSLIPLAALFTLSPLSRKPLLFDIIQASGLPPLHYFKLYCQCVVYGQLHLLLHYGIGMEAHQRNTLVSFKDNRPQALVIRDLRGIAVCNNGLYQDSLEPVLQDSTFITSSLSEISNAFIQGNLCNNLGFWVTFIGHHYSLEATTLWQIVYTTIERAMGEMAKTVKPAVLAAQRASILLHPWQQKVY